MSDQQQSSSVSQGELVTNVRYGYWFNHFCERLYARLDQALNAVQLVGGSAAAFGAMQGSPVTSAIAGICLAFAAAISLLTQPAVKAERHRRSKCEYLDLECRAWNLSFDALNAELMRVRKDAPTGIDALTVPAYNATLSAIGEKGSVIAETRLQKVARALA